MTTTLSHGRALYIVVVMLVILRHDDEDNDGDDDFRDTFREIRGVSGKRKIFKNMLVGLGDW